MTEVKSCVFRVSRVVFLSELIFGILLIPFVFPAVFFISHAFYNKTKKIEISEKNAKYSAFLTHKTINDIESIDVVGFGVFNMVKITGRGNAVIEMIGVDDINQVRQFSQTL
ncbi:MAG: hypothetical protein RL208_29 [Pseudomonadota bacterium]|jgi:hypothetical protein